VSEYGVEYYYETDLLKQWGSWCSWHRTYGAEPEYTRFVAVEDAMDSDPKAVRAAFMDSWDSAWRSKRV